MYSHLWVRVFEKNLFWVVTHKWTLDYILLRILGKPLPVFKLFFFLIFLLFLATYFLFWIFFFFSNLLFFFSSFGFFYLFIFLLCNIVLVLPYINMHPPRVYTCSPSWTHLPPPPHTIPLGHPSAPAPSFLLAVNCCTGGHSENWNVLYSAFIVTQM